MAIILNLHKYHIHILYCCKNLTQLNINLTTYFLIVEIYTINQVKTMFTNIDTYFLATYEFKVAFGEFLRQCEMALTV